VTAQLEQLSDAVTHLHFESGPPAVAMTELSLVELMEARVRRYRVWHRTAYTYGKPVQDSVGQFHLVPRGLPWQEVTEASVQVDPAPGDIAPDTDAFGNAATYFHLTDPHEALTITASSVVAVEAPAYDADALARPWEQVRPMLNTHRRRRGEPSSTRWNRRGCATSRRRRRTVRSLSRPVGPSARPRPI
jgi:transglutaminase-like putative cysteine protease